MANHEQLRNLNSSEAVAKQIKEADSPLKQVIIANQFLETLPSGQRSIIAKKLSTFFHPAPPWEMGISFSVLVSNEGIVTLSGCYYYSLPQEGLTGSGMTYTRHNDILTTRHFIESGEGQNALLVFASHLSEKHPSELTLDLYHSEFSPKPTLYSWEREESISSLNEQQERLARTLFNHGYEPVHKYPQEKGFTVGFPYRGREDSLFFREGSLLLCNIFRERNPLGNGPIILVDFTSAPELFIHSVYQRMGTTFDRQEQKVTISPQEGLNKFICRLESEARKDYEERLLKAYEEWYEKNLPNINTEEAQLNEIQRALVAKHGWEGKKILEIGSGFGILAFYLQKRNVVDVLEISIKAKEFLRTFIKGGVYFSPPNQKYDLIIAERVLEEAFDTCKTLAIWKKMLERDGRLYASWPKDNDQLVPFATKSDLNVADKIEIQESPYLFYELQDSSVFPR